MVINHKDSFKDNIEIKIYKNRQTGELFNTVVIDSGKYVLNMIHDQVVNKEHIETSLTLVRTINSLELNLDKIH